MLINLTSVFNQLKLQNNQTLCIIIYYNAQIKLRTACRNFLSKEIKTRKLKLEVYIVYTCTSFEN